MSYIQALIINWIAFISNVALIGLGSFWLFQNFGWFIAGVITAVAIITGFMSGDIVIVFDDEDNDG